jgi:hypothetical protein
VQQRITALLPARLIMLVGCVIVCALIALLAYKLMQDRGFNQCSEKRTAAVRDGTALPDCQ